MSEPVSDLPLEAGSRDWLRVEHANYHHQRGKSFGRYDCQWEGCDFWGAADHVLTAYQAAVPAEVSRLSAALVEAESREKALKTENERLLDCPCSPHLRRVGIHDAALCPMAEVERF